MLLSAFDMNTFLLFAGFVLFGMPTILGVALIHHGVHNSSRKKVAGGIAILLTVCVVVYLIFR